jgi:hypothetical protein
VASLAGPHAPQVSYYAAEFPGVDSPGQLLLLALTDVSVRAVVEHFADVAVDLGAYVTVSTNVADFVRVEGPVATLLGDAPTAPVTSDPPSAQQPEPSAPAPAPRLPATGGGLTLALAALLAAGAVFGAARR